MSDSGGNPFISPLLREKATSLIKAKQSMFYNLGNTEKEVKQRLYGGTA